MRDHVRICGSPDRAIGQGHPASGYDLICRSPNLLTSELMRHLSPERSVGERPA